MRYRSSQRQPGNAGRDQDNEDGFRAVGHGGKRVERERGQPLDGGQPMALLIGGNLVLLGRRSGHSARMSPARERT